MFYKTTIEKYKWFLLPEKEAVGRIVNIYYIGHSLEMPVYEGYAPMANEEGSDKGPVSN